MDKKTDITKEASAFCEAHNISLSTLGLRALNNGRFFDRLKRKRDDEQAKFEILRVYMRSNPPASTNKEAAE